MNKKILLEAVWWIATAVIVVLVLIPVITEVGDRYQFYVPNIFLIVLFITFTRYIFLLKHTFLAGNKWIIVVMVFLPIPIFFYATDALFNFQDFVDRGDHIKMFSHMHPDRAMEISSYIKYQFLFFGTGAMLVLFLLPVRMIISIWRTINKGTV